ncbi:PQQ-binding-like beta-propeller repeat protein [Anaeromicrobium sediminis]|uniref:pyrrolo-quinoline quinone n=1 Tax=Anaeromicrobium sediminis TaxID=1478221 RepID=UPI001FA91C42|nr:pyrrolo-quinoline quinone [Anaeromicrobium sediminis]
MRDKISGIMLCTCALFIIFSFGLRDDNEKTCQEAVYTKEQSQLVKELDKDEDRISDDLSITSIENISSSDTIIKEDVEAEISLEKIDKSILENISYQVNGEEQISKEKRDKIIMDDWKDYSKVKGVTCFRGNNFRNSASYGNAEVKDKKLEILWNVPIGGIDRWTGVGWNGQPAIVEWPNELKEKMNIFDNKKKKDNLKEVIYATLDGNVYFLDLEDGSHTRNRLKIPGPIKGSVTVDPRGIPLLYVGQGINKVHGKRVEMGYRIFDLINNKKLLFINGRDAFAYRGWSAFDSTAIVDGESDTMLIGGENGIFYKAKLNTEYENNSVSINPQIKKYRYKISGNRYQGIENSVAVYKNLAYFADNGGWIQCVDINTLKPVWIRNVTDDTDSTIAIDEEEPGKVMLYTACEVDKQGSKGYSYIRKIDALSGELIWEKSYKCDSKLGERPNNGGVLATPIIGKNSIKNMVIYNIARYGGFNKGLLVALDKNTGEEIWRINMKNYSWSSPADIYTEGGEAYILLCDSIGNMNLIEGLTGKILDTISLGSNVEGSPAIFENIAVIGTRGQRIYGIKIR